MHVTLSALFQRRVQRPEAHLSLAAHERRALARATSVDSACIRPVMANGDDVVIRWIFVFHRLDGSRTRMEALAWQRWAGNQIAQEQFFDDPVQFKQPAD